MNDMKSRKLGFTLIELMVVVLVLGILAAIVYPNYTSYVTRSRRTDAKTALTTAAQAMERSYTENNSYGVAAIGGLIQTTSSLGYYTMSLPVQTTTTFTLQATRAGRQVNDACGNFRLDNFGSKTVTSGTLSASECWDR